MSDVTRSLEVIQTIDDIVCKVITDARKKSIFSFLTDAPSIFSDIQKLVADENLVLPELKNADATAVPQLSVAAYNLVRDVITAVKAS